MIIVLGNVYVLLAFPWMISAISLLVCVPAITAIVGVLGILQIPFFGMIFAFSVENAPNSSVALATSSLQLTSVQSTQVYIAPCVPQVYHFFADAAVFIWCGRKPG